MNEYLSKGKEILKLLINNGHEAYFIGEVVRNTIIEKTFKHIDIITSASINAVKHTFKSHDLIDVNDNLIGLEYCGYQFRIQVFSAERSNAKAPLNKHYSKNLLDDLASRDYTINAIAMSHSGKLTDAYSGYEDIMKKRIRHIGNAKERFEANPILMLRAFSLMSELNYRLIPKTKRAIQKKCKLLANAEIESISNELKKIFAEQHLKKTIEMIHATNVNRVLPSLRKGFAALNRHYRRVNFEELLLMAFVSEQKIDERYLPYVENDSVFVNIYSLAITNQKAKYDTKTLFSAGLDCCLEANRINYLIGKSRKKEKKIKKMYNSLAIKNICDLAYKGQDIMNIIQENDYPKIPGLLDEVILAILNKELGNDYQAIEDFVLKLLRLYNINYDLNGISPVKTKQVNPVNEIEIKNPDDLRNLRDKVLVNQDDEVVDYENAYTNHRLDMIEQKIEEQARLLREKELKIRAMENQKLLTNVDTIVIHTQEYLEKTEHLRLMIKNKDLFAEQLHEFIFEFVKKEEGE